MHAGNRAMRSAALFGAILAADIVDCVFFKRNTRITALLRTIVHQAVFADIQITRSGAAAPLVRTPLRDVVLKPVDAGEASLFQALHRVVNLALVLIEGL